MCLPIIIIGFTDTIVMSLKRSTRDARRSVLNSRRSTRGVRHVHSICMLCSMRDTPLGAMLDARRARSTHVRRSIRFLTLNARRDARRTTHDVRRATPRRAKPNARSPTFEARRATRDVQRSTRSRHSTLDARHSTLDIRRLTLDAHAHA
jgi:hypothetical protein